MNTDIVSSKKQYCHFKSVVQGSWIPDVPGQALKLLVKWVGKEDLES